MAKELNWIDIQYFQLVSTLKEVTFTISCSLQSNPNLKKRKNTTTKISAVTAERLDISRDCIS